MVSIRTPSKTWTAKMGDLYLGRWPLTLVDSSVTLSGVFRGGTASGVSIIAAVKNITVTPPETAWEKQDFQGGVGGFQNALLDEKPVGIATVTATMILDQDELIEDLLVSGTAAAPSGYTRYQMYPSSQGTVMSGSNVVAVVTLTASDQTKYIAFGFDSARFNKWGDVRISGPDGHWEQDFTIICLPKDFRYEFKN